MRVSPLGFAFESIDAVLEEAERNASVTHNHPEGIKGAQATALAVFLARKGENKDSIKTEIEKRFAYDLKRTLDDIRPEYGFDVSCQGSVPESIIAFLESKDFEDALRKAVSLGGDSDTMACIAGGIAHAFYRKIPEDIVANARERLPVEFLKIIDRFMEMYGL
jgi:ADP-ribosylglycohydrolase